MNKKYAFTLIELLVTIAIVGILASIAVAQYSSYQQKAYDSLAMSQVANMRTSMEAVLPGYGVVAPACQSITTALGTQTSSGANCNFANFPGFVHQKGTKLVIDISVPTARTYNYFIKAAHCKGTPGTESSLMGPLTDNRHKAYYSNSQEDSSAVKSYDTNTYAIESICNN